MTGILSPAKAPTVVSAPSATQDEEAIRKARMKAVADASQRTGRASTILTTQQANSDKLGG